MSDPLARAWTEVARSFRSVGGRFAGGRDFVWLTVSMTLMVALVALLLAIERDVVESFVDSLIGKVPGTGTPIQVTVAPAAFALGHADRAFSVFAVDPSGAGGDGRFVAPGLSGLPFHPVAEVETDVLALPGHDTPLSRGDLNDRGVFSGLATGIETPLWRSLGVRSGPDEVITVVVNRAWFRHWFSTERHLVALRTAIPAAVANRAAQALAGTTDTIGRLHFSVPGGRGRTTVALPVRWVSSLPGGNGRAFVMTAELHQALLQSARSRATLIDLPMDEPTIDRPRSRAVRLFDVDRAGSPADTLAERLGACLHTAERSGGGSFNLFMDFPEPQPRAWIDACLAEANLPSTVRVDHVVAPPASTMVLGRGDVGLDCGRIRQMTGFDAADLQACEGREGVMRRPILAGATVGVLYVTDRRDLSQTHRALVAAQYVRDGRSLPVFFVSSTYRDAINRLDYLVAVLDFVRLPAAIVGAGLVAIALWVQISALLANRRAQYGLLMIHGSQWWAIHLRVAVQMATCFVVAVVVALLAIEALELVVQRAFAGSGVAATARDELGISSPSILWPLSAAAFAGDRSLAAAILRSDLEATAFVGLLTTVITVATTFRLPCGPSTIPIELLSPETSRSARVPTGPGRVSRTSRSHR